MRQLLIVCITKDCLTRIGFYRMYVILVGAATAALLFVSEKKQLPYGLIANTR